MYQKMLDSSSTSLDLRKETHSKSTIMGCKVALECENEKSTLQEGVNKITRAFESFIDLGGPIHDQMIRNKKKQKMIAIIRAIKFKI